MSAHRDPAPPKPQYSAFVPAVEQACRILLALAQNNSGKMNLTEVCGSVGIHKSKGYSILNTLQDFAWVHRSPDTKTYSLGPGLLFLAGKVLDQMDIRETVAPFLRRLACNTSSTAFLGIIAERHVFVVAKDEGMQEIGVSIKLGHRFPLSWGAHGKSIAAFLPDAERDELLCDIKLYFHGTPSELDRDRLKQELAECRRSGFAVDLGEMQRGVHAAAAPVFGPAGKLIGSLAIVGTFPRYDAEKYGSELANTARAFSQLIGGTTPMGANLRDLGTNSELV